MRRISLYCGIVAIALTVGAGGVGATQVEVTEWQLPWEGGRPNAVAVADPGSVWIVAQWGDYLARLDPDTGEFEKHELPSGTGPLGVIADDRGIWYAATNARYVGLLDRESGELTKATLPMASRGDVHSLAFASGGDIWFSVQHGNQIGLLDGENGEITLFDLAIGAARPYGVVIDGDDRPWAALYGTNMLARVGSDGEIEEITLPRFDARPPRLAITSDGKVWYIDHAHGHLGAYDPGSGAFEEWPLPSGDKAKPYAIAADDRDRIWVVETGPEPDHLIRFDPESETFGEPVAVGNGGTVRHMIFDGATQALWLVVDNDLVIRARPD